MATRNPSLLRRALAANALFSTLTGAALLIAPGALSRLTGLGPVWLLAALGVGLLLFAADLYFFQVRPPAVPSGRIAVTIFLDLGWVVGSGVLLAVGFDGFTRAGRVVVALVAVAVLALAMLQALGLRCRGS